MYEIVTLLQGACCINATKLKLTEGKKKQNYEKYY